MGRLSIALTNYAEYANSSFFLYRQEWHYSIASDILSQCHSQTKYILTHVSYIERLFFLSACINRNDMIRLMSMRYDILNHCHNLLPSCQKHNQSNCLPTQNNTEQHKPHEYLTRWYMVYNTRVYVSHVLLFLLICFDVCAPGGVLLRLVYVACCSSPFSSYFFRF